MELEASHYRCKLDAMTRATVVRKVVRRCQPAGRRFVRPRAERLLQESEARFRATFDQAAVGIAHVAPDGRWLRVNDRLCAIIGYSRDELLARTFQEITYAPHLARDLAAAEELISGAIPTYSTEKRYVRKDGSLVWINLTVAMVRGDDGAPLYFISVIEDINARKEAERALHESQTRLRLAMDAAELGIWDLEFETGEVTCSDRYLSILGLPPDTRLTREHFFELVHPDDRAAGRAALDQAVASRSIYSSEYRVMHPDGTVHWVASTGRPLYTNDEPVRVVGVALDVTTRRDQEGRQRFLVDLYERLGRIVDPEELLSTTARELREFFGFSRVLFATIDPATGENVLLQDQQPNREPATEPFPFVALLDGAAGADLAMGQTVLVRSVREDARTTAQAEVFERAAVHSLLAVPLRSDGRWMATLAATDILPRTWRPDKVALLRSVAEHLWLALENRRLYRDAVEALRERDRSLAALQESEAYFRTLTEALPQLVFTSDTKGHCTYLNQRWVDYTGLSVEESLGVGWISAFHPDDLAGTNQSWAEAIHLGETWEREYRLLGADGRYRWFLGRVVPMRDAEGQVVQWFGTSTDIDERKLAGDALERSERLFRSLSAATAQVIWLTDADGLTGDPTAVLGIDSNLWTTYTGQNADEILGMGWLRAVHADDRERMEREWLAAIARGEPFTLEYRVRRYDGAWRVMVDRGVPVRNASGAIEMWIGTGADVTAEREAEAAVRESEARLRRLFDANVFGFTFWTAEGPVIEANDAFLRMIGATREEMWAGRINWREITPPQWNEADEHALAEIWASGASTPYEKSFWRRDGTEVPVLLASAVFPGTTQGVAVIFDLTERKQQERFEQEFLAGIAHDIKNPLAAMKAQAQLMRRRLRMGRLTDAVADDGLAAVELNVTRVANRLDELMDIALLRAGHDLDLAREPVDLVALTAVRAESYRQTTDRHQIVVRAPEEHLVGSWDANRIERVVDNLFSNAIKYSSGGVVQVELRREETADGPWAILAISDEGVGIPAADLPHIFTRFARGSNVLGRVQGTGIGLAGVRLLVEQHSGTIQAESVEGEGSTFTLRLPLSW